MRTYTPLLLLILVCFTAVGRAQEEPVRQTGFTFLPGRALFTPLPASPEEVRVGLRREFGSMRMRLDLGSGLELIGYDPVSAPDLSIRLGAEMFVFALTTSYRGLHLQVDAVDGYFGGHITMRARYASATTYLRLRILHLSSHLIDGHFRLETNTWVDGQLPRPYSRDYAELMAAYEPHGDSWNVMIYAGCNQAWFCRPAEMMRFNTFQGFLGRTSGWTGPVFGKPTSLYLADHLLFTGLGALSAINMLEAGIKFGAWDGSGVKLYVSYHSGIEQYHQYYDVKRDDVGLGLTLDF